MAFELTDFVERRPYLYHLTYRSNLRRIRQTGRLESANSLLKAGGMASLQSERRPERVQMMVDAMTLSIRDQYPLHAGNIALGGGWQFSDLVRYLNGFVFFWPGTVDGPSAYGERHFARYAGEDSVVIRVDTAQMFACGSISPVFSRYNSGAPRCVNGRKSPRDADTFQDAKSAAYTPGKVVEVAFRDRADLPQHAKVISLGSAGNWKALF